MSIDEVCFQREGIEDYVLQDLFKIKKTHLLDLRVKLLLKEDLVISPYENKFVKTACVIVNTDLDFSMYILQHEQCPLTLLTDGCVSEHFTGRIWIKLANNTPKLVKLCSGTEVGYVLLNTFSLK
jgi:hypothetical protein